MTLKNNRAPLLCYFKLCTSFHSHLWILTGATVWKCPISIKINDFFSRSWNFVQQDKTSNFTFFQWNEFGPSAGLRASLGSVRLNMDITFVTGNNPWKFCDKTMTGTLSIRYDRRMDILEKNANVLWWDERRDRWKEVFLELLGHS